MFAVTMVLNGFAFEKARHGGAERSGRLGDEQLLQYRRAVDETEATVGELDVQLSARAASAVPLESRGVAASCSDCPTMSDDVGGVRRIDAMGTG